jgi:hypothetical protein
MNNPGPPSPLEETRQKITIGRTFRRKEMVFALGRIGYFLNELASVYFFCA